MVPDQKIKASSFARTRARLQRLSDAKLFSGWIVAIGEFEATIRTNKETPLKIDDVLFVQAFGDKVTGQFTGNVVSTRNKSVTIGFVSEMKCVKNAEDLRLRTDFVLGELDASGFKMEFHIVDISAVGMGIVTKLPLVKGATVRLAVRENGADVECDAEVRYSRPSEDFPEQFRSGLLLKNLDRINQARWNRLVEGVADAA